MAAVERVTVTPAVLEWARRTAGYDHKLAAKRLQVREERLQAWEEGTVKPTIAQLRKMSKVYKRPLVVLLLSDPPRDFEALRDFRRIGDDDMSVWSPALHSEFKRALTQREVILELAELAPSSLPAESRRFRISSHEPVEEVGGRLRQLLEMDRWKSAVWADGRLALRSAIEATERLGVLVLQTRDVTIKEMRGFSVSEWPHPVIVLNGSDWPRPRLFTLLHELCHLGLNTGGVCDLHEVRNKRVRTEDRIEHYCNEVAAAVLMPRTRLLQDPDVSSVGSDHQWTLPELQNLSRRYGASSEAVLLRLVSLRRASWDLYWIRKPELEHEYAQARDREKERQRQADGGPSYYTVKARNLGRGYVQSVIEAFEARAISSFDVADYLDIRFDQLPKLEEAALR